MDPFLIDGPAAISFSGGKTSGLLLRRVLDTGLQPDVHVLFANTGKERHETLDFVWEVAHQWQVPIHWLEYGRGEVTPERASSLGEPFEALITKRQYLPNPVTRFCTQKLKIRPMRDWMRAHGYDHWTNVVGLRADEPDRVARLRGADRHDRWDVIVPLYEAGITRPDVEAFWAAQSFTLHLRPSEGNCDLCFLKGPKKRQQIMRDRPDLVDWWITQETRLGKTFRIDCPSYKDLAGQGDLFTDLGILTECLCHD